MGDQVWAWAVDWAARATVALITTFEGISTKPGHVAETISVLLAACFAALGPSVSMALAKTDWNGRALTAAALFPGWIMIMLAPTIVVYNNAASLDGSVMGAHLSVNYLTLFSALATAFGMAHALWVHLDPGNRPDGSATRTFASAKSRVAAHLEART